MPRNASGTYVLPLPPVLPDTTIEATWANTTLDDLAQAMTNSLSRDGQGGMSAPFRLVDGAVGTPGLSWQAETSTGLYRESAGVMSIAVQGAKVAQWTAAGLGVLGTMGAGAFVPSSSTAPTNGLYLPAANTLGLSTASIERLRISANGNVGIGSSTGSDSRLYVYQNASAGGTNDCTLFVRQDGTDPIAIFSGPAGAERMRITSGGSVSVGGSGDTQTLNVYGNSQTTAVPLSVNDTRAADGVTSALAYFRRAGTLVGSISTTNSTTLYNTSSDYRLKNISGDLQGSGAFIDALQPRAGTWKADGSPFVGFVAHELQSVSPSSVTGEKDGEQMQSVAYGSAELIANMVAELKALRLRVVALEA